MIVGILLQSVFVVIPTSMIVLMKNPHCNKNVGVVILESLVHSMCILLKRFYSVGGHTKVSCLRVLACMIMNDAICKSK